LQDVTFVQNRLPSRGLTLWLEDFNCGDQDPETAQLAGWTDAWTRVRRGDADHSYDLESNPPAREYAVSAEPSRRLDRTLTARRLVPIEVGLTDKGQSDPTSDHDGLWADLVPPNAILDGNRSTTVNTALRLARFFNTTAQSTLPAANESPPLGAS
jgi:endonuclease/exonuclease/phosphatase family metal-dependent hydrolase